MMVVQKAPLCIMAHLVAGYPTTAIALSAAQGLAEGGVSYFEVQFPFSDPSADGSAIQSACSEVLSHGYTVSEGFKFVTEIHTLHPQIPVFIMTYGNLAFKMGIDEFVRLAAKAGATGLIIPDLPFDTDEGLDIACQKYSLVAVPVAAPSMTVARLASLRALRRPFVYAALRSGITGAQTIIDKSTLDFIHTLSDDSCSGTIKILGGFGIKTGAQSLSLSSHVHAVVAGSVFVELIAIHAAKGELAVQKAVALKAKELSQL